MLVLFSTGWAIRNYLRSGVLSDLARSCNVVAALRFVDDSMVRELATQSITAETLPELPWGIATRNLRKILDRAYQYRHPNVPLRFRRAQAWRSRDVVGRLRLAGLDALAYSFARHGYQQLSAGHTWLTTRALRGSSALQFIDRKSVV